jgi:hypothetical protein
MGLGGFGAAAAGVAVAGSQRIRMNVPFLKWIFPV